MCSRKHDVAVSFSLVSHDTEAHVKVYTGTLHRKGTEAEGARLRVKAEEMAECYVNGHFLDVSLWSPHEFDLSGHLVEGENTITLKITGNAANRFTNRKIEYGLL